MKKEDWIWMPHAGHLCVASNCRFVLNTYVGGFIVSTVGEWIRDKGDLLDLSEVGKYEDIGFKRKYETMVFHAKKNEEKSQQCCPYLADVDRGEVDFFGYSCPIEARNHHNILCKKWSDIDDKRCKHTEKDLMVVAEGDTARKVCVLCKQVVAVVRKWDYVEDLTDLEKYGVDEVMENYE